MEHSPFNYILLLAGVYFALWGLYVIRSDEFYERWRDKYWKVKNDEHSGNDPLLFYRYIQGTSALLFGLMFIGFALFVMFGY